MESDLLKALHQNEAAKGGRMGSERTHVDKYLCTVCGHRHSNGWYCKHSIDAKDAEIERLKAQLEEASQRVNQTCFVCRRSYYDHAFRDEGSGACRQFTTGIEAGLRNTNDDLRAQLSASEEKRKVLAKFYKTGERYVEARHNQDDMHNAGYFSAQAAYAQAKLDIDAAKALEAP